MAILLTSHVDLQGLHQWTDSALREGELLVYAHGWLLRAEDQPDFVIEADNAPLSTTHQPFTPDEMNAAIVVFESAKQKHPTGWRCLEEVGLTPADPYVRYAFANADAHLRRLAKEDRRLIYSAGWLNGLGVGAAMGGARR